MYPLSVGLVLSQPGFSDEAHSAIDDLPVRVVMEQPRIDNPLAFRDSVEQLRPDVLVLDYSNLTACDGLLGLVREPAAPAVFVVHQAAESDALLASIRAGAREFLFPPFGMSLQQGLERVGSELEKQRGTTQPGGKVFGVVSAKGGCGASTIACHASVALRRQTGKEVLLVDFDLTSSAIRHLMQVKSQYSVLDALENVQRLDLSYWRGLATIGPADVEVLPGPVDVVHDDPARAKQLRQLLRFVRLHYDFAFVDFGHGLTPAALDVFEECDQLMLVAAAEVPALRLAQQAAQLLERHGYGRNRVHLVLNQATPEFKVNAKELEDIVGLPVYATLPSGRSDLTEAYTGGWLLPQGSALYRAIARLAYEAAGLPPAPVKKRFPFFR